LRHISGPFLRGQENVETHMRLFSTRPQD
jgi:hypothetical protein